MTKYHTIDICQVTVMPTYRRLCKFSLLMHLLIFHIIRVQFVSIFSILISAKNTAVYLRGQLPEIYLNLYVIVETYETILPFH